MSASEQSVQLADTVERPADAPAGGVSQPEKSAFAAAQPEAAEAAAAASAGGNSSPQPNGGTGGSVNPRHALAKSLGNGKKFVAYQQVGRSQDLSAQLGLAVNGADQLTCTLCIAEAICQALQVQRRLQGCLHDHASGLPHMLPSGRHHCMSSAQAKAQRPDERRVSNWRLMNEDGEQVSSTANALAPGRVDAIH